MDSILRNPKPLGQQQEQEQQNNLISTSERHTKLSLGIDCLCLLCKIIFGMQVSYILVK